VYNLAAAGMCALGAPLALALVQSWGRRLPRRLLGLFGWGATGLLALRGGAGIIQVAYLAAMGTDIVDPMVLYDLWFCLGAVLFFSIARRFRCVCRFGNSVNER